MFIRHAQNSSWYCYVILKGAQGCYRTSGIVYWYCVRKKKTLKHSLYNSRALLMLLLLLLFYSSSCFYCNRFPIALLLLLSFHCFVLIWFIIPLLLSVNNWKKKHPDTFCLSKGKLDVDAILESFLWHNKRDRKLS